MDEKHVAAVHEAGHVVAVDRVGGTVRRAMLIQVGGGRWHGQTDQAVVSAHDQPEIDANDRAIALSGPEAERRFTGHAASEPCEEDLEIARILTERLGGDQERVEQDIRNAFQDQGTWRVTLTVACALLESTPGVGIDPASAQLLIRTELGAPTPPWPTVGTDT